LRWDELKKTEHGRSRVLDGVAFGQPAAALAGKLGARAAKFAVEVPPPAGESAAEAMFRIAYAAGARGDDPESALRAVALAHADALAAAQRSS
jgi:XTP/dITP diphosphohydrolase